MVTALVALAGLVALWFALPLLIAPLALLLALFAPNGRRRRSARPVDVHEMPTLHPSDDSMRVANH